MSDLTTTAPLRLRPLIEPLDAPDGDLYMLQGAGGSDHVIRSPTPEVRAIVGALQDGATPAEIADRCAVAVPVIRDVASALDALDLLEPQRTGPALTAITAERLDRQLLYLRQHAVAGRGGDDMQQRLAAARIIVIGCGGLGSWTAWALATLGIGELVLLDPDDVEASNLNRQLLFASGDIGRSKALLAAERLRAFDPSLRVTALRERVDGSRDVAALAEGATLLIACADTPPYDIARWINEGCARVNVPHISAGQMPPAIRIGPFVQPGATACVACLEASLRRDNPLAGALETTRKADPRPAATLGPACGLIGSLIGLDVLHWLTGIAEPATWGAVVTLDIRTFRVDRTPVDRLTGCPVCSA